MELTDRVYGYANIEDEVLLKLMHSTPLQRLQGISQHGASKYVYPNRNITRYEHSVGVMILLHRLKTPLEEQIAGLLHDLPHTAFSHVIDYVFTENNHNHDYHEQFHEKIIMDSEIPQILDDSGYSVERILDEHNFPLLERKIPDLCADRIDYTLRGLITSKGFTMNTIDYLSSFIDHHNEVIMRDGDTAYNFATDFLDMDDSEWANPKDIVTFQLLADAIKIGLEKKVLTESDLFKDDRFVYNKLKGSRNQSIQDKLRRLNPKLEVVEDPDKYDYFAKGKLRYIDPKFSDTGGQIRRVSDAYPDFAHRLKEHNGKVEKGHYVRIVDW